MGKKIIYVPECHSTNDLALKLAAEPDTYEGTVVITDRQLAGRGQRGNGWFTEHGKNLTFSIILRPSFLLLKDQFYLNICISLAVRDLVAEKLGKQVFVKWPNDIIVEDQKICGILIENQLRGDRFTCSVAGIGLNVNQQQFELDTATSMGLAAGGNFILPDVLESLLEKIEVRYLQLRQGLMSEMQRHYLDVMYRRHELRVFSVGGTRFGGIIQGIDNTGRLHIDVDGEARFFAVKEVEYVK